MDNPSETLRRFNHPWWRRYGAAIGLILLAGAFRQALTDTVGLAELPFIFFFPAIALAAWYSGLAPALVSLLLAIVLANRFFLNSTNEITANLIFVVTSVPIVIALDRLRRAGARMAAEIHRRQMVEVEQERTRRMLQTTIASIGDGVIVTDAHGAVTSLNTEAERMTGWSTKEAAGRPLRDVFHILNARTRAQSENPVEQALERDAVVGLANHTILVAKDGREIPIDDSAAPIQSGGTVFGVVLVFRDVTEQRLGEQFRSRLAAIVEFSGDAIITKDLNGIVQTWNAAAERMLGYKAVEMVGRSITTIIPPDRLEEETEILGNLRKGLPYHRVETVRVRKDGGRIPVSISASPIKDSDGNIIGASKILHDVSDIVAARDALARETQLLETTLRSIGDAVIITDARGDVTFLNPEAERLTGWTQADAVARNLPEVFSIVNEETRQAVEDPVDKVLATGSVVGLANHTLLISRDGRETPIDDSAAPIRPPDGRLLGVVLVFRDFTARREAERALRESEERFRIMADAAPVLIWVSDTSKQCTWFNQRWLDFVGRTMEQEIGEGWVENVHPDDLADCLQTYVASFEARRPFTMTYRLRRADGAYRWVLDHGIPRLESDGGFAGYIGSCIDITERKQAEDTLQRDARRKDEFLAVLSHELRNPLGAIRMAVYLLNEKETSNKSVQRVHTIIDRQTTQMTRLLDDLMDVSRISSGRISLRTERIDLLKTVTTAAESVQPQMRAKTHVFMVNMPDDPIYVDADPARLAQIVSNLLNNAARYTSEGGRIRLTVRREKNSAVIRVHDSGIGLTPEQMPHIFGMFTQVDRSAERGQGGLGVGLALSKQLVQLHGGSIEARSEGLGKGSEFIVRLPLAKDPATPETSSDPADVAPLSKKRVLIADDNIDSATALADLLSLAGHEVHTVYDGSAAVETAKRVVPDVAILDIGMPKMDGYEAARQIRAEKLPIILIALTGWGQEQDRQRARDAGFDYHLTKPVDLARLEELLQSPQERS